MAHCRAAHSALQNIYLARSIACRGQHTLAQFSGDELYAPAASEPPPGTQAHRTDTFVREVRWSEVPMQRPSQTTRAYAMHVALAMSLCMVEVVPPFHTPVALWSHMQFLTSYHSEMVCMGTLQG